MSVSSIGAMLDSLVLASLPNKKRGLMLLVNCFLPGIALVGFLFSSSWPPFLVFIPLVGLGQTGRITLTNTVL